MIFEEQDGNLYVQLETNMLKELFGTGKRKTGKSTEQIIREARKELGVD